ncbi:MAG: serine hydrolase [Candidatus Didemnitutus sp.]|nr:serine hydrolase [Candidatus Didemnitutus sp.]
MKPVAFAALSVFLGVASAFSAMPDFRSYSLDGSPVLDSTLQQHVEAIDASLRARWEIPDGQTSVGVLDLRTLRLAWVRPDRIDYAASVPKVAILLGWFAAHPEPAALDATTRHELGLMIKQSDNELAAKFSQQLGLGFIRGVLDRYALYDAQTGGGIWLGKHYGKGGERVADPVGGHSHAATVRQLLRFYLLLEQDQLVSAEASAAMRDIFRSPDIPHKEDKFVAGLAGRAGLEIRRKAGWWEDWNLDTAVVTGPGRHYVIVAMVHHAHGEEYLRAFAAAADDLLAPVK